MRITIVNGEKNVDDLIGKIYGRISKAKAAAAKQQLLKANPQLDADKPPVNGSTVIVPESDEPAPREKSYVEGSASQLAVNAAAAMDAFREHLTAAATTEAKKATADAKLLQTPAVKALIKQTPALKASSTRVSKAIGARQDQIKAVQDFAKGPLAKLQENLSSIIGK